MKNLITVIALFLLATLYMNAQDISKNAVGVRFGDNDGFGGEISYQYSLGDRTRMEVDLSFRNNNDFGDSFKLTALHQWVWRIDGDFNWYAGFGTGIGSWDKGNNYSGDADDGVFLNADGNVGIEYNFEIPLLISLDFRPEIDLIGDYGDESDFDIALSLRYQF